MLAIVAAGYKFDFCCCLSMLVIASIQRFSEKGILTKQTVKALFYNVPAGVSLLLDILWCPISG